MYQLYMYERCNIYKYKRISVPMRELGMNITNAVHMVSTNIKDTVQI